MSHREPPDIRSTVSNGYVRVTSLRRGVGPGSAPRAGETVYRVDRANPVLGNPYRLKNMHDASERAQVIAAFGRDFELDLAANGPMAREVERLAERLRVGEKICLACWCSPAPCHGDLIAAKVRELVECPEQAHSERNLPSRRAERPS